MLKLILSCHLSANTSSDDYAEYERMRVPSTVFCFVVCTFLGFPTLLYISLNYYSTDPYLCSGLVTTILASLVSLRYYSRFDDTLSAVRRARSPLYSPPFIYSIFVTLLVISIWSILFIIDTYVA